MLNGAPHFNLEQGILISRTLRHNEDESQFFLLLIQYERAGTKDLREFLLRQIQAQQAKRLLIRERVKVQPQLSMEDQLHYYSEWYYVAAHILSSIPDYQDMTSPLDGLGISPDITARVMDFLVRTGLVEKQGTRYAVGKSRVHLPGDSPLISKHHANWRIQALRSLDRNLDRDLHYTSVVSVSRNDVKRLMALLIDAIEKYNAIVAPSPEEECRCLTVDFFKIAGDGRFP
ncbi:MAG: DUF4423 domain-containing protein [Bdellovibrionales bacterium]|nr:DUF4423 domain-containing protein [Bdellovibrionales bacterium]